MTLAEARARIGGKVAYVQGWMFDALVAEARAGKDIYRPGGVLDRDREEGVITSVNDTYVFVRYGAEWQSKATRPEDLVTVP